VKGFCVHGNEPSDSVNDGKLFARLSASEKRICSVDVVTENKPKRMYCSVGGGVIVSAGISSIRQSTIALGVNVTFTCCCLS
jgi:hypothetical protein